MTLALFGWENKKVGGWKDVRRVEKFKDIKYFSKI